MKRSKFTEDQIAFALHQADTGETTSGLRLHLKNLATIQKKISNDTNLTKILNKQMGTYTTNEDDILKRYLYW